MQDYQFLKELGSGSFGRVIKVRKHNREVYAMKQIKLNALNAREKDNALNEVRLLASIDAPNVISYKTAFFQETGSTLCILMEYADGGDLAGLIRKKKEKVEKVSQTFIWRIALDILQGLKMLHQNSIIHRDIKPANIFFVGGVAKLGDLNVSKVLEGKYASTQTGTPYYTAPQIWNNQQYDGRVDIWSLGCVLYELAVLRPPFIAKDFPGLSRKVLMGVYDPIPAQYSKKLSQLIKQCLQVRMSSRPVTKELLKNSVFEEMQKQEEGQIELLDTIRCPKLLKNLNKQLPEVKSMKKIVTIKDINEDQQGKGQFVSKKQIGSSKAIKDEKGSMKVIKDEKGSMKLIKDEKQNEKAMQVMKVPMQSPSGYVKLPRIQSNKNILY